MGHFDLFLELSIGWDGNAEGGGFASEWGLGWKIEGMTACLFVCSSGIDVRSYGSRGGAENCRRGGGIAGREAGQAVAVNTRHAVTVAAHCEYVVAIKISDLQRVPFVWDLSGPVRRQPDNARHTTPQNIYRNPGQRRPVGTVIRRTPRKEKATTNAVRGCDGREYCFELLARCPFP